MRIIKSQREKFRAKVARMCITLAQNNNDPLFILYQKHRKIFWTMKYKIIRKYTGRAATEVRASMRGNVDEK